jgi:flavin-dependent dehydrogenase
MKKLTIDVAVIGNGPAGSTVALMLAKSGISVSLISLSSCRKKLFGETVHPNIKYLLVHLGVWKDFLNDEHLQSPGNLSAWGDAQITENNFIFHPNSYGWHLDRSKFNLMLLNAVEKAGVYHFNSKISSIHKHYDRRFSIILKDQSNEMSNLISADFIVDATGRASWFSRRQGIQKNVFDTLCGYVCFLSSRTEGDSDAMTLIESAPDGWWYSALLPKYTRVVAFFSDSNLSVARSAKASAGWKKMMHNTEYIKLNIDKYNYHIVSGPHIGDNWLAVGDAAATYDPISSRGIITAINDGINASDSIVKRLNGNNQSLEYYNEKMITTFNNYLKKRTYYYKLENRWLESDFWKQNQKLRISN